MRFSRRATSEFDLLAELDERLNAVARLEADLAGGDFTDGDIDQLRGGRSAWRLRGRLGVDLR